MFAEYMLFRKIFFLNQTMISESFSTQHPSPEGCRRHDIQGMSKVWIYSEKPMNDL